MNPSYSALAYGGDSLGYQTVETLLDDVSKHMATSNLIRHPRGSTGQRSNGGSMRVVKPNSTSNSPRGSKGLGRRRTVVTDPRRRIAMADQNTSAIAGFVSTDGLQYPTRSNRPVSWHPSTQMTPRPQYYLTRPAQGLPTPPDSLAYDRSPVPGAYLEFETPDSSISPISMPYSGYEQNYAQTDQFFSHQYSQPVTQVYNSLNSTHMGNANTSMHPHLNWSNFAANSFGSDTSPPTPAFYLPAQHPEGDLPAEDLIPYHSLSDPEPEGEILQGLGLYDAPEGAKSPPAQHFDSYRALVMSQLLGTACKKFEPEPTGKGLKLEETWNPPLSDDEEEEDEDDEDQDGEADEEHVTYHSNANYGVTHIGNGIPAMNVSPIGLQADQRLHSSWL